MSTPDAPPETEPSLKVSPISMEEITGPQDNVPVNPAPSADPPKIDTESDLAPIDLGSLFGEKPKEEPAPKLEDEPSKEDAPEDKSVPALLRKQLAEQKKNHEAELKQQQQRLAELEEERDAIVEQFDVFRREASITDPNLAPEVVRAGDDLDVAITKAAKTMPPVAARAFKTHAKELADAYSQLGDINDPEYDTRYAALQERLNKQFGSYAGEVMKTLPELEDRALKIKEAVSKAMNNSSEVVVERAKRIHDESFKSFTKSLTDTLTYSEEVASKAPFATRNIVSQLLKASPEYAETSKQMLGFLEAGLVSPSPSIEASGLTPQDRENAQRQLIDNHQRAFTSIRENAPLAFHALAALPMVTQQLHEIKQKYDALIAASPSESHHAGQDRSTPAPVVPQSDGKLKPITLSEITG